MEITRFADLKPRNVWEITDDAFDLYRERFALLASVSAVVVAPALILFHTVGYAAFDNLSHAGDGPDALYGFLARGWTIPALGLAYLFQASAVALVVRDTLTMQESNLGNVYKRLGKKFFPLFLVGLGIGLAFILSSCIIIGPLMVTVWYAFVSYGIVLEDRKVMDAAKRSREMGAAYFGKTLGLLMLMGTISMALTIGLELLIAGVFSLFPGILGNMTPYEHKMVETNINSIGTAIVSLVLAPLPAIAMTLLYYDLRVRREGLDIESEAEETGITLAPDPFGGVLNPKVVNKK